MKLFGRGKQAVAEAAAAALQVAKDEALLLSNALEKSMAIIEFKPTGEIIRVNENFCSAMGYRQEDIVCKHHRLLCLPAYASGSEYQQFWRDLSAGKFVSGRFKRLHSDGS